MDIILPPVTYDALEQSITTHGIGAGRYYTFSPHKTGPGGDWIPCCLVGHFEECVGPFHGTYEGIGRRLLGIGEGMSDRAVRMVNARKRPHRHVDSRITWEEYRDELSLLKGVLPHDFTQSCDGNAHESSMG